MRSDCTVTARHRDGLRSGFRYAFAGLWWALTTQRNMRIHVALGAAAFVLGLLLRLSTTELAVVALTATLVLAAEMLNTVVEAAVDLASPAYHPLARIAKDVSAGAVLVTSLGAIAVGLLVYLPHLLSLRYMR
jgi:diacylglycerol kinase